METLRKASIENPLSTLYIDADGVLITKICTNESSLQELDRDFIQVKSITNGHIVSGILEVENSSGLGKNYLTYLEREYSKVYKALAIITPSKILRFRAFVNRTFSRSKYPVKFFSSSKQAKDWLKGF